MPKLPGAMCGGCPLNDSRVAVPGCGPQDAHVIIVGEAPGANEEIQGVPFVGQSGHLLDEAIKVGSEGQYDITKLYRTNVVACRPDGNREPSATEIACCRPRMVSELQSLSGRRVLALGNTAHAAFGVANKQRGAVYDVDPYLVVPVYHPAYVLRDPDEASAFLAQVKFVVSGDVKVNSIPWPEVRWMHSTEELHKVLSEVDSGTWVSFDIETDQIRWYDGIEIPADTILMLQITWDPTFAIIIDDEMLYDTEGVVEELQQFFDRMMTIGQNCKFDAVFLKAQLGLSIHQDFDLMLAHYTLDENLPHGLKAIATQEFGIADYEVETIKPYLKSRNDRYSKVPPDVLAQYGAMDVVVALMLRPVYEDRLADQGRFEWPFKEILMRAANGLTDVEIRGMTVDQDQLAVASEAFQEKIFELVEKIRTIADWPDLNPGSTKQMAELLYDRLGLPEQKGRRIKPRSTNKDVLAKMKGLHPVIPVISELRRVAKMKSSYVDNIIEFMDSQYRVHGNFKIPGTEVSRLSIADPALQTIPRPSDYYGALIRSSFVAREGFSMVVCDYSQAELRVFACASMEPFLLGVYRDGRDLHTEVALAMFGEKYTKEQRVLCKMFNFSYIYGGSEYSFAMDTGLNIDVARGFVHKYNEMMPVGLAYKRKQFAILKEQGYVETIFGRRRNFPLLTAENMDEARKACVHMPCASTASDLTLLSALDAQDEGIPVVLTVHDSILVECEADRAQEYGDRVAAIMKRNGDKWLPQVPWKADVEIGKRWAEALPSL